MSQRRYVVVAKVHRKERNGENIHGDTMWHNSIEEHSSTFTADQPISAIFEWTSSFDDDVVEIRLLSDESNYARPSEQDGEGFQRQVKY